MKRPLIVGIAGGSGSGKSTLAQAVVGAMPGRCVHLVHDRYYRTLTTAQLVDVNAVNFDHPDALDTDRLLFDVDQLMKQGRAKVPLYDFATHRREEEIWIEAKPIVLVEGILAFTHAALVEQMDLRVFVDASEAVRLARRVRRDVAERGRTVEAVRHRFELTVRPMHDAFVAPSRACAHHIVDGTGELQVSVDQVLGWIRDRESELHP